MKTKKVKMRPNDNTKELLAGDLRGAAAKIIFDVMINGRSLADSLPEASKKFSNPRDRALLQAISYGVCRWFYRLDAITRVLLEKPLKDKDLDVHALLLVGLYQLADMRIPAYAAIAETVAATKGLGKIWAKGLVNAVLREYQRNSDKFDSDLSPEAFFSHPRWMIEKLEKITANETELETILDANNEHPPFALRVNQQQISRAKYLEKLTEAGLRANNIPGTSAGIVLEDPVDVERLPGFAEGEVSVQDGAAQLAAELLMLEPGQRVLDACAAPGGKTAHILELQPTVECIAVDHDAQRLTAVTENLQRLKLSAKCIAADVGDKSKWWDGQLFDRVLLDAPCSATGVIRRHPDIKLLRRPSDIPKLAETQLRLLNALWEVLKPGGILLYATCSIFPEENSQVLEQFLATHPEAKEEKLDLSMARDCAVGKQIFPGVNGMDGFYFARLRK